MSKERLSEFNDGIEIDSLVKIDKAALDAPGNLLRQLGFNEKDAYRVLTVKKDPENPRADFLWLGPQDMSEADKYAFRDQHENKSTQDILHDIDDLLLDDTKTSQAHVDAERFRNTGLFMRWMLRKIRES